jgi:hypothetical protein
MEFTYIWSEHRNEAQDDEKVSECLVASGNPSELGEYRGENQLVDGPNRDNQRSTEIDPMDEEAVIELMRMR